MNKMPSCISALVAAAVLAGLTTAAHAQAVLTRTTEIVAQPLNQALSAFAKQTGLQLIYVSDLTNGQESKPIPGGLTAKQALTQLLAGTSLTFEFLNDRTVRIFEASAVRPASTSSLGHPSATTPITDAMPGNGLGNGSFWSRFRLAHADQAQSPAVADGPESAVLEEVVVTAQKKEENIQDVPASISVIGGQRLETLGATQLSDYAAYVPGLIVDSGGTPGQTQITLRGLPPITSTTMVGTYIDDSPLGSSAGWVAAPSYALDLMPYDIDRIEVLRGPQGTLYGANTMGGLLKYVTRAPETTRFMARVGSEVSTIEGAGGVGWGVRGSVNLPLVEGKMAISGSAFDQFTPGYIDNGLTGEKNENEVEQKGGRIAFLWKATDAFTVKLSAMGQDIDADGNAAVSLFPETRQPIFGDLTSSHRLDQPFRSKLRYFTATLNWDLRRADFVSATSYARTKVYSTFDASGDFGPLFPLVSAALPELTGGVVVPAGLSSSISDTDVKKLTQEFRLSSPAGQRLEWLLGAFHTDEDASMFQLANAMDNSQNLVAGLNPFFLASIPTAYRETAAFANVTYKFTDAFDLSVGARFARNKQDFKLVADGAFLVWAGADGTTISSSKESVFTYSIAPRWHVNDDTMVYARVASGYRPGGPNSPLPGIPPQVDSDRIVNYELGFKSELANRRATIDVAAFRVDWKDIQSFGFHPSGVSYLANGGRARSQGAELSLAYTLVRGLRLGFNTAYTDAKLIDAIPSLGGLPGDPLPYAPRWSGAATADYQFPINGEWAGQGGGGFRHVGKRTVGFENGSRYRALASYTALDLHAGLVNDRWAMNLFVKNATDKRAYLTPVFPPGQVDATILQPRTIGFALEARF